MEGWEKEEFAFDTEATNTINLPDHRKLHIDPHIPRHVRVLLARGYEVGRALALQQGNIVLKEKIVFGATGETLDFHSFTEREQTLMKIMAKIGHLAQEGYIQSNVSIYNNNQANVKNAVDYIIIPEKVSELMKNLNLVKKSERNQPPEVEQVEMDPMEGTSGMYNDNDNDKDNDGTTTTKTTTTTTAAAAATTTTTRSSTSTSLGC